MTPTERTVDKVADRSLAQFVPQATYLASSRFCSQCQHNTGTCFPCGAARVMIRWLLMSIVQHKAKLN